MSEQDTAPLQPLAHMCSWVVLGAKNQQVIGIKQTSVLMRCRVCGDLQTKVLNGEWSMVDITRGMA